MKTFAIGLKDLRVIFRDRKALAIMIAMPLILIAILGAALGPVFSGTGEIGIIEAAIVDNDHGQIGDELKTMLTGPDLRDILRISEIGAEEAQTALTRGSLAAVLYIPEGFSEDVLAGRPTTLEIKGDPGSRLKAGIFKGIVDRFAAASSGVSVGVSTAAAVLAEKGGNPAEIGAAAGQMAAGLSSGIGSPRVSVGVVDVEGVRQVSSFQYYAAGMTAMFILFSGMFGIKSILEERNNHTLMRLMVSPVSGSTIISGKFIGILMTGFLQAIIIILVTRLVFGVYWGRSVGGLMLLAFASVFAVAGLSIFIAAAARSARGAELLASIGIQLMSLLGGSMVPLNIFPEFMQKLSYITVNRWAIQGFNDLMMDQSAAAVIQPSVILAALGIVFLGLGTWRIKLQ